MWDTARSKKKKSDKSVDAALRAELAETKARLAAAEEAIAAQQTAITSLQVGVERALERVAEANRQ